VGTGNDDVEPRRVRFAAPVLFCGSYSCIADDKLCVKVAEPGTCDTFDNGVFYEFYKEGPKFVAELAAVAGLYVVLATPGNEASQVSGAHRV